LQLQLPYSAQLCFNHDSTRAVVICLPLQGCNERRLDVTGEWAWLLQAFASQYGVRSNYAVMTHLRWVLRPGVASVSQNCFDLLARQLRPLLEQEAAGGCSLTQHEVSVRAAAYSSSSSSSTSCGNSVVQGPYSRTVAALAPQATAATGIQKQISVQHMYRPV
jgi:hypothetical protein